MSGVSVVPLSFLFTETTVDDEGVFSDYGQGILCLGVESAWCFSVA